MANANGTNPLAIDPVRAAESRTADYLAALTVIHALALIFVGLRLYVRVCLIRAFGKDDAIIALAALFAVGGWVTFVVKGQHGLGRHKVTLSKTDTIIYRQMGFWYSIMATDISMCLLKVSIALNLLRFCNGTRWYFWALWSIIVFVSLYSATYVIMQLAGCQPIAGYWDPDIPTRCFASQEQMIVVFYGAVNTCISVSTDIALAALPIPMVWNINLALRTRVYLVVILSLGYLAVGLGIVKTVYQLRYTFDGDSTYNLSVPFWGFLQINVGIIAACSVSLRPLVARVLRSRSEPSSANPPDGRKRAMFATGEDRAPTHGSPGEAFEMERVLGGYKDIKPRVLSGRGSH